MALSAIFHKPIDRPIEGVIKADDEASLHLEVSEYVLTNEVAKRLENFLAAYNHYEGANGVWISGFFGSGKSHLLKMLALLLANKEVDGESVLELFLPKCGDNEILRGDLKRAVQVPSESILFNIDQKADIISKTQVDALLAVFVKVFDEMCGYYGKQGHIAQLERDLDSRGRYEAFKAAFRKQSNVDWTTGREQALLEAHHIAAAYAEVTGVSEEDARGILNKYRADYKVSIEDFADKVDAYIQQKGDDFRLNFFVDEVGQYIADNVKLMTNLQTIAESLATKCRGRSWIIVTAQEDMNAVLGEMGKQQTTDFSKIQDRFKNRMKLTSADVAEVIRKRLLHKNEEGIERLSELYAKEHNNFKTLFDFGDGSQTYRNFRDRDEFIHSYPFIPYQFALFQAAIQNLSQHNAFEGKYSSVGERSMLGVFQDVAIQIGDHEIGELATFDLMYEGIRTTIKSQVHSSISTAEKNLDHPLAVKVLKALFLVKYVKEFKATARNIAVLMLDSFGADIPRHREQIEEALARLEQETYIQRNGDVYEYLTDEEQDVEAEIKNTEVETEDVAKELASLVFDHVLKQRKIRYDKNEQDYAFTRKLDDQMQGKAYELSIHVISPFHEHSGNEDVLKMQSMGKDELVVLLPSSDRLVRDLLMYKKTEKYIRQNISSAQQESIKRILTNKQFQNRERLENLRKLVQDLLAKATLILNGQELNIDGSDAATRITKGFYDLLVRTYPNLRMLRGIAYKEEAIGQYLNPSSSLFGEEETMSEAEREMLAFVQSKEKGGLRTTLQSLVNHFERKPYGWYLAAIQCILAKLCTRGKIELRLDGSPLEEAALEHAIRNTRGFASVILLPQVEFTASQVRGLRDFYADFFDGPPAATEAKALGKETAQAFKDLLDELTTLSNMQTQYPFLSVLGGVIGTLRTVVGQPYTYYLTELRQEEDALFDLKEDVITPVRAFMNGTQKAIYTEARAFLQAQEPNLAYVAGDDAASIREVLDDAGCYRGNGMQQVKARLDALGKQVQAKLADERKAALTKINEQLERLTGQPEFLSLTPEQQAHLRTPFEALQRKVESITLIAVIHDAVQRFEETEYPRLLAQMSRWASDETTVVKPLRIEYVPVRSVKVDFDKPWLADADDVDRYVETLRSKLLEELQKGKRIQI